ncbi:hypothetical protein TNCV_3015041 [Trichonephila clavipes]|nr:hypothetical protein TNCV_3015041 [Trichonephila clavipes]
MAAPLTICTKEERIAVISFLFAEGVKPAEIIRRMQVLYGISNAKQDLQMGRVLQESRQSTVKNRLKYFTRMPGISRDATKEDGTSICKLTTIGYSSKKPKLENESDFGEGKL